MSDPRWNHLPDELKKLGQKTPETPTDPVEFKERVLREYERRTRGHLRSNWLRGALTAVTMCTAVLVGLFVSAPSSWDLLPSKLSPERMQSSAVDANAFSGLTKQEVVEKYIDLNLQKRQTESEGLLAKKLQNKPTALGQNRTQPHMTGYRLRTIGSDGSRYEVTVNWASYTAEARTETLEVGLAQEDGRWTIDELKELQSRTYQSKDQMFLTTLVTNENDDVQTDSKVYLPYKGSWAFFAANPANENQVAMARQAARPEIYLSDGKVARLLTTMPQGEIGEMLWGENGLLVVNFSPASNLKSQELWFVNTQTGETYQDDWLVMQMKDLRQTYFHAVHMLPNNRLRLRIGTQSYIADITRKTLTKEDQRPVQIPEVVYDSSNRKDLPASTLSFLDPVSAGLWLRGTDIPSDKRIDPAREVGYYLMNGSVQSITMGDAHDLQVEVSQDPGHLQVLRIPYERLRQMSGEKITIHVFDEGGLALIPSTTVTVP